MPRTFRKLAQANRLANLRLYTACEALGPGELEAERTSFFPSILRTLNHNLTVDWFYVDALEGGDLGYAAFTPEEPFATLPALAQAQADVDERLLAVCLALEPATLGLPTRMHRGDRVQVERTDDVLVHLFLHQVHHRGQVHAMLAGSSVAPPQLDEFVMGGGDVAARRPEMERLGWSEDALMR